MRECNDEHSFEFQICTVCAVGELNFNQKNEAYLSPVALGPLEGGESALLREEPAELAGVERWRQLYKIGLPGKSILRDYTGARIYGPRF